MQSICKITVNSNIETVPEEQRDKFELAVKCHYWQQHYQKKLKAALTQVDDATLDMEAREKKMEEAMQYEDKATEYGNKASDSIDSINATIAKFQNPATMTLREQLQKLHGHIKVSGNNLKPLVWRTATNGEAEYSSAEKALKALEMTLLEILGHNKEQLDLFYPLLVPEALTLEQKVWFKETFKGHNGRKTSWKEFQQAFEQRFAPSPHICKDLHKFFELVNLRMLPGKETIEEYIVRFREAFEMIRQPTGMLDNYVLGHLFIESLPVPLQQAIYQQLMSKRSNNGGDPMDVDGEEAGTALRSNNGSDLVRDLNDAMVQAKNCSLLASLDPTYNDVSIQQMAPPYTTDYAKELGYVNTLIKPNSSNITSKGFTIQGRAAFAKIVSNHTEGQKAEHDVPSTIYSGQGDSTNSSFVNAGHADSFNGRRSKPNPTGENNAKAEKKSYYCDFHQRMVWHKSEDCDLNPNKPSKMCKNKCGNPYFKGHNAVCTKLHTNKSGSIPVVAGITVSNASNASNGRTVSISQQSKRKAQQALLSQNDIDRSKSSRYAQKKQQARKPARQVREPRVYGRQAQEYAASVREFEQQQLRMTDDQMPLNGSIAIPSLTRATLTASKELLENPVEYDHGNVHRDKEGINVTADIVDVSIQQGAGYDDIDMGDVVNDKPINLDNCNLVIPNNRHLVKLDEQDLQDLSEE